MIYIVFVVNILDNAILILHSEFVCGESLCERVILLGSSWIPWTSKGGSPWIP